MLKRLPQDQLETESKHKLGEILDEKNWKLVEFSGDKFGIDGEMRKVD